MRHFSLLIDNAIRGPLTEKEINALIKSGEIHAETRCAPVGTTEWVPLSNHFSFGSTLKLKRTNTESRQAEQAAAATRLTPGTRKKLMNYGLADSASLDRFTQIQADEAIAIREEELRARALTYHTVRFTVGGIMILVGLGLGLADTFAGTALDHVARTFIKEDGDAKVRALTAIRDFQMLAGLRERVATVTFDRPFGGTPLLTTLDNRLKLDPAQAYLLSGQVTTEPLAARFAQWGIRPGESLEVTILPAALPAKMEAVLKAELAALDDITSPALDDAGLEKLFADTLAAYPTRNEFPESARLLASAKGTRISSLKVFADRVNSAATAAEGIAPQKKWAADLRVFAGRVNELQRKILILNAPDGRRQRWNELTAGPGAEFGAWLKDSHAPVTRVGANHTFTFEGAANIDATMTHQVIVAVSLNQEKIFLPWNSAYLKCGALECTTLPRSYFIAREQYKVVAKIDAGGERLVARHPGAGHTYVIERTAPIWRFLTIARAGDTDAVVVLVDEKTQAAYPVGKMIPIEVLAKLETFPRAVGSTVPDPLTLPE